ISPSGPAAPTGPVGPLSPAGPLAPTGPVTPAAPTGGTPVGAAQAAKPVVPAAGGISGRQLLDQAAYEFSKGEFETAAKLAQQAHNAGEQDDARRLLNTIDAERHKLKTLSAARSFDAAQVAFKNRDYNHA